MEGEPHEETGAQGLDRQRQEAEAQVAEALGQVGIGPETALRALDQQSQRFDRNLPGEQTKAPAVRKEWQTAEAARRSFPWFGTSRSSTQASRWTATNKNNKGSVASVEPGGAARPD